MNEAQRELLVRALSDVAKGVFVGALLAAGAGKLSFLDVVAGVLFAVFFYIAANNVAGGIRHD